MKKENLLEIINKRSKIHDSVLVSVKEFFEDNNNEYSFAANVCNNNINVFSFYKIFNMLSTLESVQDVWILITDIDEEWPYSDTVYISSSLKQNEINNIFGDAFPSEINEVDSNDEISDQIQNLKDGYKLYCLWWD